MLCRLILLVGRGRDSNQWTTTKSRFHVEHAFLCNWYAFTHPTETNISENILDICAWSYRKTANHVCVRVYMIYVSILSLPISWYFSYPHLYICTNLPMIYIHEHSWSAYMIYRSDLQKRSTYDAHVPCVSSAASPRLPGIPPRSAGGLPHSHSPRSRREEQGRCGSLRLLLAVGWLCGELVCWVIGWVVFLGWVVGWSFRLVGRVGSWVVSWLGGWFSG